jgi:hypothetical protein
MAGYWRIRELTTMVTASKKGKKGTILVTAVIIDEVGNVVKGHALCDPADTFDEHFGASLAVSRAYIRYFTRQEKFLRRESDNR